MSRSFSLHLDVLRVIATFVVLVSHFAYERFSRGDFLFIREWNIGSDAVVLFFVISGFVISFTTENKDGSAGKYAFARLTRLYSVVLPALVLTVILDAAGIFLSPEVYDGKWYNPAPAYEILVRGLSFSTEWSASAFRAGTNGPFWSLSYEAAYYLLFGIAVFSQGLLRVMLLSVCVVLIGIKPLLLIPAWLMGVWLHRSGMNFKLNRQTAIAAFVYPLLLYVLAVWIGIPNLLMNITVSALGVEGVLALRFSNEFIWNAAIGFLATLHLIGAVNLLRTTEFHNWFSYPTRWLAGASFSIYLVHYPALQFWHAILPGTLPNTVRDVSLLGLTLALCIVFAALFERTLPAFRQSLKTIPVFRS